MPYRWVRCGRMLSAHKLDRHWCFGSKRLRFGLIVAAAGAVALSLLLS